MQPVESSFLFFQNTPGELQSFGKSHLIPEGILRLNRVFAAHTSHKPLLSSGWHEAL
jgi:hypothetical protein